MIDGKFTAGAIEKGIAEDSLYLDFDGSAYEIPAEVMEQYNAVVAAIKDGTIRSPAPSRTPRRGRPLRDPLNIRQRAEGLAAFSPALYPRSYGIFSRRDTVKRQGYGCRCFRWYWRWSCSD